MRLFHWPGVFTLAACLASPTAIAADSSLDSLYDTSRFLSQATFGADFELIVAVETIGQETWLASQLQHPPTLHQPIARVINDWLEDLIETEVQPRIEASMTNDAEDFAVEFDNAFGGVFYNFQASSHRYVWMQNALYAPDMLRQRVAFALSEIFVVSDRPDELEGQSEGLTSYYDILVRHALGNYRDLLRDVTLHPVMGFYLSHLHNAKADPANGLFPDENYAREVMQLFSIGLFELNPDGSRKLDAQNRPIPTYSNQEITEFAKIFTGFGGAGSEFGVSPEDIDFSQPMTMHEEFHEPGEKRLLNGVIVPPGQSGMADIESAVDSLFNHPNVGPFIGRQLIQRLVTSNPSPAYVARVTGVFNDNGNGVRGDLGAVVRAILLDTEARSRESRDAPTFGHLQEPFLRHVAMLRMFRASNPAQFYIDEGYYAAHVFQQYPLHSPSVFNFFLPNHQPSGAIAAAGLVGPEFQLATSPALINNANFLGIILDDEPQLNELPDWHGLACLTDVGLCEQLMRCAIPLQQSDSEEGDAIDACIAQLPTAEQEKITALNQSFSATFDLSGELQYLSANVPLLLTYLDLVMTHGTLSATTRALLTDVLTELSDDDNPEFQIKLAIYYMMFSPDYVVIN